ncbi:unnamed protein product [Didymodactylos carnosus]|uniref:Uncharacterized protein n=1 Tax=Didymodactylos carnosus TaxID=1234261 RepID=A0A815G409_9BILA|nr:unnamed protein product [Didymodactylos carnosus]CAF4189412.1 unnamed protein product [Didymodactylos carnosus]
MQNYETFCLVWLDLHAGKTKENIEVQAKLQSLINDMKMFNQVYECEKFIKEAKHRNIILVTSGSFGRDIVPRLHNLEQLRSIYVYCMDKAGNEKWAKQFTKNAVQCQDGSTDDKLLNINPQFEAAIKGNLAYFISTRPDFALRDPTNSEQNVLHLACKYGNLNLFLHKANTNIVNNEFLTATQLAKTVTISNFITNPTRLIENFRFCDLPPFETSNLTTGESEFFKVNSSTYNGQISRQDVIRSLQESDYAVVANYLNTHVDLPHDKWCEAIIHLYSMETPLYKTINCDILAANPLCKCIPYIRHLSDSLGYLGQGDGNVSERRLKRYSSIAYRGATLTLTQIEAFRNLAREFDSNPNTFRNLCRFPAFTSFSKSKSKCLGGNTLFILHPILTHVQGGNYASEGNKPIDISPLSAFPKEEEVLLNWSEQIAVLKYEFLDNKHVLHVEPTSVGG